MREELRKRIISYNQSLEEKEAKAADLDILISKIVELLPEQLKNVLTEDILDVLRKYCGEI